MPFGMEGRKKPVLEGRFARETQAHLLGYEMDLGSSETLHAASRDAR